MKVTFLGTGTSQGIPVIGSDHPVCKSIDERDKRLRASILIEVDGYNIVVDCTPDFRQQMLLSGIDRLDALVFTHEHADHTMGLDDIRPFFFKQGNIPIYAHERVLKSLAVRFDYIFQKENKYPGAPSVDTYSVIPEKDIEILGNIFTPIDCLHASLQVFGYRVRDFAYLTDVKTVQPGEMEKLMNLDVLVLSCLRKEPHRAHLNLEEAINFINLVQPKKTYLTHISHLFGFHAEVSKELPENVYLAYDNLQITL